MPENEEVNTAIMIDLGSGTTKVGFVGADNPSSVFPTVIGQANKGRLQHIPLTTLYSERPMIGEEAVCHLYNTLQYPIRHGIITDYDLIEKILHHALYNELRVAPEEQSVMISNRTNTPNLQREKLTQIMFETFSVPAFYLAPSSVLTMFASGRNTGIVLDCGDGVTSVETVCNGYHTIHAAKRISMGGSDVDEYLSNLIFRERGYELTTSAEMYIVKGIKEKLSYVALDFDEQVQKSRLSTELEKCFELPDGNVITLGRERFQCMEAFFQPHLIGREDAGIHELVFNAIQKCDLGVRRDFYGNVLLSGASTLCEGFEDRLAKEMNALAPSTMHVKVVAPPERKYSVWIGGSILGSLTSMANCYITKDEYDEDGPTMVLRKCY
ncbi:hypothetical protein C9374_011691 [Naegleria lovaniensis]|uniref:Actin n=1 Tax=Naegleria lovaniensis TaxID=51637 RepID=A0AA88KF60_NAELO|nr:uncharacterized protein C9374_011691 [Naegleria lovaniensis]KAG2373806.1 hypothetical protein C9374_011691 [Naegleria lovaniensis]